MKMNTENKKSTSLLKADISLLLIAIFWGSSYIATKIALKNTMPFIFLFLRFAITSIIMLSFIARQNRRCTVATCKAGMVLGCLLFLVFCFETFGIQKTTPSNAGLLICLCVVITPFIESVMFKKKLNSIILIVVIFSFFGAYLLVVENNYQFNIGDFFVVVAAFIRAFNMNMIKWMTNEKDFDSAWITLIQLSTVAVLALGAAYTIYPTEELALPIDFHFWIVTLYMSVFCTIFAFYVQTVMIQYTTPTRTGLLLGTEPVFSTLFAITLWGESISLIGWLGATLIICATYVGIRAETIQSQGVATQII